MTKRKNGSGWHGESRRHGLARMGVSTVLPDGRRLAVNKFVAGGKDLSSVWNINIMKDIIEDRMSDYEKHPSFLEYDDGRYELFFETISSGGAGTYQPEEIADFFGLVLPSDAKDVEGNRVDNWRDYEWAWEDIEREANIHSDYINDKLGMRGTVYFGHAESDNDYGLIFLWEEGDYPSWDKFVKKEVK